MARQMSWSNYPLNVRYVYVLTCRMICDMICLEE